MGKREQELNVEQLARRLNHWLNIVGMASNHMDDAAAWPSESGNLWSGHFGHN